MKTEVPDSLGGLFDNYNEAQFRDLMGEYNKVAEWMAKDFPDVTFRLDFNLNKIVGVLVAVATIHTSAAYSNRNSMLERYRVIIPESMWYDAAKMADLIRQLAPRMKQQISTDINNWYMKQKEWDSVH
jgi:hypothetical protein